uniref:Uncharacterized protein n=1 Tax=Acrobeloides nanus TaxID=290746 RepID=A0A914DTW2_9BILA
MRLITESKCHLKCPVGHESSIENTTGQTNTKLKVAGALLIELVPFEKYPCPTAAYDPDDRCRTRIRWGKK